MLKILLIYAIGYLISYAILIRAFTKNRKVNDRDRQAAGILAILSWIVVIIFRAWQMLKRDKRVNKDLAEYITPILRLVEPKKRRRKKHA